ncbi:MAG: hypothetical protein ACK53J_12100 [Betaproteobacteria bacterium]
MYLRESKQRRADGSTVSYLQLAENLWSPERRRSETHVVYNCGRADDPTVVERLRKLAASILRRCSPEQIVGAGGGDLRLVCAWPYGEVYVLQALWQRLGIDQVIGTQAQSRHLGFDVERALFAMVANRACAPCSKLYCWEQWLKEEVGNAYRVVYVKPCEDPDGRLDERREVLADGKLVQLPAFR